MERQRLGRGLSLVLFGLGGVFAVSNIGGGSTTNAILGVLTMFVGVAYYRTFGHSVDTGLITFVPTNARLLSVYILQLGIVFFVFALITSAVSDIGLVTDSVQTGVQAPTYFVYLGGIIGLSLGGGVAVLSFRWDRFQDSSRSPLFGIVGFSITFGTYFVFLLIHLQAALIYAAVYAVSRLVVLLGMWVLSRQ